MALELFTAGWFMAIPDLVEWDGANHSEILDRIHALDVMTTDPAQQWTISEVSADSVTFTRPPLPEAHHFLPGYPYEDGADITLQVGDWLAIAPAPSVPSMWLSVRRVDPAGKWKTADRFGRPADVTDMLAGG